MNLTPTELERLTIFTAAELARRYRSKGIRLSHPEAIALICDEVMTAARQDMDHPDMVALAGSLLTTDDVQPGVRAMIPVVSFEVGMAEGTKLVTVFDPIKPGGSADDEVRPGEIIAADGDIEINAGRAAVDVEVLNTGDRAIQVRSHAHFFETNRALEFDRAATFGMRLDAPSGVGARFDPGVVKTVRLVKLGGTAEVFGEGGLTNGDTNDADVKAKALAAARAAGYRGA
ncbi:MAG: urease subunit beta [Alphaproteobacteria bacterium]